MGTGNYIYQKHIGNKDNRTVYNNAGSLKKDAFYDTPFESDGYEDRIRVPKLKRKNAWKRFYKLYPNLKGKKVITGYSSCSSIWHLHSSMIKLKKKKK